MCCQHPDAQNVLPFGWMRLHWRDAAGYAKHDDYPCLHDALERAGVIYARRLGTLDKLQNWMGEDACPPEQLLPVAQMRAARQREDA